MIFGSTETRIKLTPAAAANNTKKGDRHHESALMAAAHILVCLTKKGKSIDEITKVDFDNNFELVSVWIDYMIGIKWMYKDGSDNKWIATDEGKKWIERLYDNTRDG